MLLPDTKTYGQEYHDCCFLSVFLFMGRAGLDSRDDSACICGLPAGQNMSQGSLKKSPDMFSHPDGYIEPCDAFCV